MRVLMLDKNILVDRRIDLFSMSLKARGHETRLLYLQPPPSFEERFIVDIEAYPVADEQEGEAAVTSGVLPQPVHVMQTLQSNINARARKMALKRAEDDLAKMEQTQALEPHIITAQKRRLVFKFPELYAERLRKRPYLSRNDRLTLLGLDTLAIPQKIRGNFAPPIDAYPESAPSGKPLTYFDRAVVRHAIEVWKPDIVTANDFPTLRAALTIKQLAGTPVIYDAHELYSYQPGVPLDHAREIFAEERKLLKFVDGLIVMNELQARVTERDFKYAGIYTVCTNATNRPADFDPTKRYDIFRERLPIPQSHKIMLFQGGVNTGRRIDFLLRGLAKARRGDVHMVFLTWGQEVPEFKQMALELGLRNRVHFLPFVDWDQVIYYAASADCGFMPYQATDQNTAISSPNKMYEFIMAATPMIGSSDLHYVNEIVGGEGFGVVRPLRADIDYALAIEEMFDETLGGAERFRPALIEKSPKYAWDVEVQDALQMYDIIGGMKKKTTGWTNKAPPVAKRIKANSGGVL